MTHLIAFPCSLVRRGSRGGAAHRKWIATPRANKGKWPPVGRCDPPGALRPLPDAERHRAAGHACPAGRSATIKWVIISDPWYCSVKAIRIGDTFQIGDQLGAVPRIGHPLQGHL